MEKESLKLKEYQDMGKAELKKLKDEIISKNTAMESLQERLKEKGREQETLLRDNKSINSTNIDLKDKLATLKIKIC
jgi:molybdopterin converting factor small subunit